MLQCFCSNDRFYYNFIDYLVLIFLTSNLNEMYISLIITFIKLKEINSFYDSILLMSFDHK